MKFVQMLKDLVAPSAAEKLARLDAHLLADIGATRTYNRFDTIRVPADLGFRLI